MKKLIFTIALFVSIQAIAFAQGSSPVLENAVSKIKTTITDHIIEKAYLHFDRQYPLYVAGDIMYFKAYVTMGELHQPSSISGILHVDLIGKNNALLQTKAIQLTNGLGWGDFTLPDTMQKGSYRVRAYTNYMRNGDNAYFFDKHISISSINNVDRVAAPATKTGAPVLQFFPESGNLVAHIHTRVAYKATGPNGLGINLKGMVFDNDGKAMAKIESGHFGMGKFDFIPEEGKKYVAKVIYSNGTKATVNLPDIVEKGIALIVNTDNPAQLSLEIVANPDYYKENMNKDLNLLVYWSGSVKKINTKLDNPILSLELPTTTMMTGVLQATLFSATGEPLCERLAFIQNNDLLNLAITADKTTFAKRENVMLALNAKNKDGKAVNGSFSVSVIDESKVLVDENSESTILTNILLTADLKGYIEQPNYYFTNVSKETRDNLDVLMLTQGYRRFVWKQLLNENATAAMPYKPEHLVDISGSVKTKDGVPASNLQLTLLPREGGVPKTTATDEHGKFSFTDMAFVTGTGFFIKMNAKSAKKAPIITLDNTWPGEIIGDGNEIDANYNPNADILASLQNGQRDGVITASNDSRVYLRNTEANTVSKNGSYRSSNIGGPGHADQVIYGKDLENSPSLVAALNGVARGVDFRNGTPYLKPGQTSANGGEGNNPMTIVIDGVLDGGTVEQISPRIVETVEILKGANASIYGLKGGTGVIVITTKESLSRADPIVGETLPGVYLFNPPGIYKAKEFYSPAYNVADANKLPDTRTTIFWKPNITTDADGKAAFSFFNSDGTGSYRVVVEGMDNKGNLGRQVFKYKVQ